MRILVTLLLAVAVASTHARGDGDGDDQERGPWPKVFKFGKSKSEQVGESSSNALTANELESLKELKGKSLQTPAKTIETYDGICNFINGDLILNSLRGKRMEELQEKINTYNDFHKIHKSMYYYLRRAVGEKELVQAIKSSGNEAKMYQYRLMSSYVHDDPLTLATLEQFEDIKFYNLYKKELEKGLKNIYANKSLDPIKKQNMEKLYTDLLTGSAMIIKQK